MKLKRKTNVTFQSTFWLGLLFGAIAMVAFAPSQITQLGHNLARLGKLEVATLHLQRSSVLGVATVLGLILGPALMAHTYARQEASFAMASPRKRRLSWSIPQFAWYGLRIFSVGSALGLAAVLFVRPALGLFLFWRAFIPFVPLLFFVAPGLWRNICPMAALNQTPRLFHFTRGLTLPKWMQEYGYLVAISLFLILVVSRKVIFNQNGAALAGLILCALAAAFVTGCVFKGKSGWCSSICPLLPVQRIYGQTPFVNVTNNHCQPCIGCTQNCYDANPHQAYLADLYGAGEDFAAYRKVFVGLFPGFVLAFYILPSAPAIPIWQMVALFALYSLVSLGSFFVLDTFTKTYRNNIPILYGALALNLYYWFNAPLIGALLQSPTAGWFVWSLRTLVLGLTLFWIYRTHQKEQNYLALTLAPIMPTRTIPSVKKPTLRDSQATSQPALSERPQITVEPEGRQLLAEPNRTLLEIIESHNLPIEAGCRMGLCGADPICVLDGMDQLSKAGNEERTTLERLSLAPNTRLACMARVHGDVKIALKPEQPQIHRSSIVAGFKRDKSVERVVIVGNGIAGVTAADHVRRRHPHCEIHLIGRERHHLYNRMAITRLIYGRSAMQGLYLLPDKWYDDFNITCWLNTHVTQVDTQARQVNLGTGETLGYDRLILTTGSQSFVPPIQGYGLSGTFVLRSAEDAMAIRSYVQEHASGQAVVAGGGLLGLEAAYSLHKLGLAVTVLERSNSLLRRQLDIRGGQFLGEYLTTMGIQVVMDAEVSAAQDSMSAPGRLQQVLLHSGRVLPCDLLLVAAGIRADVGLAQRMGLATGQGVLVDDQMRTSDPDIFAAGDVAEFAGKVHGLWPVAVSQAEVAAANAVAAPGTVAATYQETPPVTILKVAGIDLTSVGQIDANSAHESVIALEENAEHRYRKLVINGGKIIGAILLGYPLEAPGVIAAIRQKFDVTPYLPALQAGDWEVLRSLG